MAIILGLWGCLAGFGGFILIGASKSSIHEIEAGLAFLVATVAIGCAGIIEAVNKNTKAVKAKNTVASPTE